MTILRYFYPDTIQTGRVTIIITIETRPFADEIRV